MAESSKSSKEQIKRLENAFAKANIPLNDPSPLDDLLTAIRHHVKSKELSECFALTLSILTENCNMIISAMQTRKTKDKQRMISAQKQYQDLVGKLAFVAIESEKIKGDKTLLEEKKRQKCLTNKKYQIRTKLQEIIVEIQSLNREKKTFASKIEILKDDIIKIRKEFVDCEKVSLFIENYSNLPKKLQEWQDKYCTMILD